MGVQDYYIGKGIVSFKQAPTETTFRDVGNVPEFEWQPEIEKLDHFSSRSGVKSKDRSIIVSKAGQTRIVLEEWTIDNLAVAFLGGKNVDAGTTHIDIFNKSEVTGQLKFVGTNDVGTKFELLLLSVSFIPGSAINMISDEWGSLELTGEVSSVAPLAWAATTAYVVGDIRKNGAFPNTKIYEATVAGTSAGSGGPSTFGSAIVDGTVTWRYLAVADAAGAAFGNLKNI